MGALGLSFAAHVPDQRDTRWFFSLPLTPTLVQQARLLVQAVGGAIAAAAASAICSAKARYSTICSALRDMGRAS